MSSYRHEYMLDARYMNMHWAQHDMATRESADWLLHNMPPGAKSFADKGTTLEWALMQVKGTGYALEFGVGEGASLEQIRKSMEYNCEKVVGFDSFEGLPEDWKPGYPKGTFSATQEEVDQIVTEANCEIVIGLFQNTLDHWMKTNVSHPISFLHIDSDLYSSAKYVLERTVEAWESGTIIVFDEFLNYPGWMNGECRAWLDFLGGLNEGDIDFEYIGYTYNHQQVVIKIL